MRVVAVLPVLLLFASPLGAEERSPEELVAEMTKADPKRVAAIREELVGFGPAALPAVIDAVIDKKSRQRALPALRRLGAYAGPYVKRVAPLLTDEDEALRYGALIALLEAGPEAAFVAPGLRRLLSDEDELVRVTAACGLLVTGQATPGLLLPVLQKLTESELVDIVRVPAIRGLVVLAREDPRALETVVAALSEKNISELSLWCRFVADLGPMAGPALPALRVCLKNPDLRLAAAQALVRLGRDQAVVAGIVARDLRSEDEGEVIEAMWAAGKLPQIASTTVPVLLKLTTDPMRGPWAWQTLAEIASAPAARTAVFAATSALDQPIAQPYAARFLSQVGEAAKPAKKGLVPLLDSRDPLVRLAAAAALLAFEPELPAALRTLSEDFRLDADTAVGYDLLVPAARNSPGVIAVIAKGLADKSASARESASSALAEVGPAARTVAPALLESLEDPFPEVRAHAVHALGRVLADGPKTDGERKALRAGLSNSHWIVRGWCAVVLLRETGVKLDSEAGLAALQWAARHHEPGAAERRREPAPRVELISAAKNALARLNR